MKSRIVVVGSLNADLVIRVGRFPLPGQTITGQGFQVHPGGKGANQACAAARAGGQVSMVGQVGNDAYAEWLRANLTAVGVDVSHVAVDGKVSSGIATITIDETGQNEIIIVPGANGTFNPGRLENSFELIRSAGLVLLQLEVPMDTVLAAAQEARRGGAVVILDPAPARSLPPDLLALADYVTPNETELAALTGVDPSRVDRTTVPRLAHELLARGARKVIAKMGRAGALLIESKGEHFWPSFPVQAVDTTAAGDAFNGAFAAALAAGKPELDAGYFASAAAAISVTRQGAQPSMPRGEEVETFLKTARA